MIDGMTKRYALLGGSLAHTHSPFIHNELFSARKENALYLPMPCSDEVLPAMVAVMRETFAGFNITIPYKEKILQYLDEIDDTARAMGAVNTVKIANGRLHGWSTDGQGFIRALKEAGLPSAQCDVLLVGCGGTARSLAWELLHRGCKIWVCARDKEKAACFAQDMHNRTGGVIFCEPLAKHYDLLCNTTPVGMYPNVQACPVEDTLLGLCGSVFDAIYNPLETVLLKKTKTLGLPALGGLSMLYYQAVEAQTHWGFHTLEQKVHTDLFCNLKERVQ